MVHNSKMMRSTTCFRVLQYGVLGVIVCFPAWATDLDTFLDTPKQYHSEIIAEVDKAEAAYKQRLVVEPKLIRVLNSSAYSKESKTFIAGQLYRIADEDTVPAWVKLLYRNDTSLLAAKGLGVIGHSAGQHALLKHLSNVGTTTRVAIIEALGDRRDDTAIGSLIRYVRSSHRASSKATLIALGKIGGPEAVQHLSISRLSVHSSLQATATQAYLTCGWTALERGDYPTALDVFDLLFAAFEPLEVRAEALRGLIRTEQIAAIPYIIEALEGGEPSFHTVVIEEATRIPGEDATQALVKLYADFAAPLQAVIVQVLGQRADAGSMPTVIQATRSRDPQVRLVGLEALGNFRESQVLQPLLKAAAEGTPDEQVVARASLTRLEGDDMNHALAKMLLVPNNAVRLEAVKMMPIRGVSEGLAVLVRIVERGDLPVIQYEALKALCTLGTTAELSVLVEAWIGTTWSPEQRALIGEGIIVIAQRSPAGKARVEALHNALSRSTTLQQLAIITALNRIQEDASVTVLDGAFRTATPEVQEAILTVWGEWPSAAVLPMLEKQARTQDDIQLRVVAYTGLVRILNDVADPEDPDTAKYCQKAAKIANTTEKRRALFPAIAALPTVSSTKIWGQLLKADASLSDEIEQVRSQ